LIFICVNNFMVYMTGDIPVGAYDSARLANLSHEFSAVAGFTSNFTNSATNYRNGGQRWARSLVSAAPVHRRSVCRAPA
jgi:hypothetical protein